MINFPNSPTVGQQFTAGGITWAWDGTKWAAAGTGPGVAPAIGDNRIINGDMRIDQRNNGASGTAQNVYTVDRWFFGASQGGKGTWGRGTTSAPGQALGLSYFLVFTSSSAYVSLATDAFNFYQAIEADMITDFAFGTANAQSVTLSFWVQSTLTGTFSGALRNAPAPGTRSYPFTFQLPTANIWTRIVITIPGDTGGIWVMSGNAAAVYVSFDLGSGSNLRGPANVWAPANYAGVTGSVSTVGTNGAQFLVTGVKLEIGSVATPFNRYSLAKCLADCQRYYCVGSMLVIGYQAASGNLGASAFFSVPMRAAPTVTPSRSTPINMNGTYNMVNITGTGYTDVGQVAVIGSGQYIVNWTASAEL